ncbi:hypothetical protein M426DRAFT_325067 [Hypoxylon sp. CI-4A]|nr:hypothetical protein M426DRAFT_325067 [Hypoxylon sp. CI-4A]
MTSSVPSSRVFMTSLIDSLNAIPQPTTTSSTASVTVPSAGETNPLKLIPAAHRPLLTTLYALYPLTLLPALDILDRRLATRIIIQPPHPQHDTSASKTAAEETNPLPQNQNSRRTVIGKETPSFYRVRSAQPQHPRRGGGEPSPGLSYVVRLDAWNCTCAAFAFAAFPREERDQSHGYTIEPSPSTAPIFGIGKDDTDWQFGALSVDGLEGSGIAGVPCCKHLLACVLAERWDGVLGGYVDERVMSKEEGAGLVADI